MKKRFAIAFVLVASCAFVAAARLPSRGPTASAKGNPVYVVTTAADNQTGGDGLCSLREAIILTDITSGSNDCGQAVAVQVTINFNIGMGTPTIAIDPGQGPLPVITRSVAINGNTGGADRVEISRVGSFIFGSGLYFSGANAGGSVVNHLVINGFAGGDGILVADVPNFTVRGSFLGTNAAGTAAVPNLVGITASPATNLLVGGTNGVTPGGPCTGDCNVISGNEDFGVIIGNSEAVSTEAVVRGNFIGTDVTGTAAIPNDLGVWDDYAESALIGGSLPGQGNVISGNRGAGIWLLYAVGASVQGNYIGIAANGSSPLGNSSQGIENHHSTDIVVGGGTGLDNVIAYNAVGVFTDSGADPAVNQNSIYANGKGIETTYHTYPTITGVNPVTGHACANCTVEVFSDEGGQGRIYEGTTTADGQGNWTFSGPVVGPNVTATMTQQNGTHFGTSEFSAPFLLPPTPTPSPTLSTTSTPTPTPTGSITPTTTGNASATPTDSATPTPTSAASPTPTHTPTVERVEGDLDCDGHIDLVDFDLLLEFVGQLNNGLTPGVCPDLYELFQGQRWGDFNCDGFLTARDALYLLEYDADLSTLPSPPAGCPPIGTQLA